MKYAFTATTLATFIPANLFAKGLLPQSVTIFNNGLNPFYFTGDGTASAADCIKIAADSSISTMLTQPLDGLSFITTGGDTTVVIETF